MALKLTDGSVFLHMPRAGGTFVTAVLKRLDLIEGPVGLKHDCPGVVDMPFPRVVFLRDPYDWIASVYAYQSANDWPLWPKDVGDGRWWHPFTELNEADRRDFDTFIRWLVSCRPGFVSRLWTKFADWPQTTIYDTAEMGAALHDWLPSLGASHARIEWAISATYRAEKPVNSYPLPPDIGADESAVFFATERTAFSLYERRNHA